ncbi:hypothetical protein DID88_001686 [Monilinia fructigena]|uniref:Uncharacterized protein n=1 Tax=Monilinia fructigena TaxID=38457 RepID=A0A395IZ05_9HELO|nr:hypothetical protein DID88_001686 [Monilinia fructigena]
MLLPPIIEGFVLEKKTWNLLTIDGIKDPKERDVKKQVNFKDLVLPEGNEHLLKATESPVWQFFSTGQKAREDFSQSKRSPLIFNIPLYSINQPDFGLSTWDAGRELAIHFQRAKEWNCIVAIPDAENKFPHPMAEYDAESTQGSEITGIRISHLGIAARVAGSSVVSVFRGVF